MLESTSQQPLTLSSAVAGCIARADLHEKSGEVDRALVNYRRALALTPHDRNIQHRVALCLRQKGDFESSVDVLQFVVDADPRDGEFRLSLGLGLIELGRHREAIENLELAVDLKPDLTSAWVALGELRERERDLQTARESYEGAVERQPELASGHRGLARVATRTGNLESALVHHQRALEIDPGDVASRLELARILGDLDRGDQALDHFLLALEHAPEEETTLVAVVAFLLDRRLQSCPEALGQALVSAFDCPQVDNVDLARPTARYLRAQFGIDNALIGSDVPSAALEALRDYPLWHLFLCHCVNTDAQLERWIRQTRRWILLDSEPQNIDPSALVLAACVGRQCLRNGHVYGISDDELEYVERISGDIDTMLAADPHPSQEIEEMLILESMYRDPLKGRRPSLSSEASWLRSAQLRKLLADAALLHSTGQSAVEAIWQNPISCPADGSHTAWDQVPQARPRSLTRVLMAHFPEIEVPHAPQQAIKVLVATPDSGRSAVSATLRYREASVTALDPWRPGLDHASRMAHDLDLEGIRFLEGDIDDLVGVDTQYNVIECLELLALQQDPAAGLGRLVECLEPNGVLRLGLPSRRARHRMMHAHRNVVSLGLRANAEGVRAFRERVLHGAEPELIELLFYEDFYTLDQCRKLLFPAHAHRFSPADIGDLLAAYDLEFLGFEFRDGRLPLMLRKYFPDTSTLNDLDTWHKFEELVPTAFMHGFNFWCRRPIS